jgi:general secretion pathway protein K
VGVLTTAASRSRGFALVIVLWSLGGLALVGSQLTATARGQLRLAASGRDRAMAEAAADGAVRQAMFTLLGGGQPGTPIRPTHLRIGDATIDLAAEDEAVKINPNTVSRDVLQGLLVGIGVDQPRAARLAGQIADWRLRGDNSTLGGLKSDQYRERSLPYRSGDGPFLSVDEVGLVPDMTPAIMARLRPWLSIYQEGDVASAAGGSPAEQAAADARLAHPGPDAPRFASHNAIMRITAVAVVHGRARFVRSAIVRVRDNQVGGSPVQLLTWEGNGEE